MKENLAAILKTLCLWIAGWFIACVIAVTPFAPFIVWGWVS